MKNKKMDVVVATLVIVLLGVISNAVSADFMWGNLVLNREAEEMQKANVNPVIYPHWLHRTWFRCKVCHVEIVIDKQGANKITMKKIEEGKVCGACHNGQIAFGVKDNCERCHALTPDGPKGQKYSPDDIPDEEFKQIANRVGASWNPEVMGPEGLPRDKFKFIDWIKMVDMGIVDPIHSLDPEAEDQTEDSGILFNVLSDYVDNVLFSHNLHSYWMSCDMCHDKIFKKELGANRVRMMEMVADKSFCIHCHGKVSFPAANCTACHKWEKGAPITAKGENNIKDRHEQEGAVKIKQ